MDPNLPSQPAQPTPMPPPPAPTVIPASSSKSSSKTLFVILGFIITAGAFWAGGFFFSKYLFPPAPLSCPEPVAQVQNPTPTPAVQQVPYQNPFDQQPSQQTYENPFQ